MARKEGVSESEEYVYRISTAKEWEALQSTRTLFGGELDKTTGCIHLSRLHQVQSILQKIFLDFTMNLYLLQIDAKKLGDGLIYEVVYGSNVFPYIYGPVRSSVLSH